MPDHLSEPPPASLNSSLLLKCLLGFCFSTEKSVNSVYGHFIVTKNYVFVFTFKKVSSLELGGPDGQWEKGKSKAEASGRLSIDQPSDTWPLPEQCHSTGTQPYTPTAPMGNPSLSEMELHGHGALLGKALDSPP